MMRLWLFVVLGVTSCAPAKPSLTQTGAEPLPTVRTTTVEEHDETPPSAARISATNDAASALDFPRAKELVEIDVPKARTLLIEWRIGHGTSAPGMAPVYPLELTVGKATLPLGKFAGTVAPVSQSYCYNLGWHMDGDRSSRNPSIVSRLLFLTVQGDSEHMLVRAGSTLVLLHRETSDGMCDKAKQGPLDVCEGSEWERRAEIHLSSDPVIFERINDNGEPLDCSTPSFYGMKLSPP